MEKGEWECCIFGLVGEAEEASLGVSSAAGEFKHEIFKNLPGKINIRGKRL